jgi:hypothetical protein
LIAHWKAAASADPERPNVAYFQLYPSATTINATVTKNHVRITYPNTTQPGTDRMEFRIAGIPLQYYQEGKVVSDLLVVEAALRRHNGSVALRSSVVADVWLIRVDERIQ